MPFPFTLPTTSSTLLCDYFDSVTHPALPLTATTKRNVLRDVLKRHQRLSAQERAVALPAVQSAVEDYVPYLLALDAGTGYRSLAPEMLHVDTKQALTVAWRSTLAAPPAAAAAMPGREAPRAKVTGLHHELAFTLSVLAYTHSLLARAHLRSLYATHDVLSADQRTTAIATAMKHLMEAHAIHTYVRSLPSLSAARDAPVDIYPSTVSALASLALAEATIIVVAKDDPYTAAVSDVRNAQNKDWMFKAPSIPKVRAHLYARFCLAAAAHAASASSLLVRSGGARVDDDLIKYANDLRRTARGKAARFLAIDAELSARTGEALAWLKGARTELGLGVELEDGRRRGFKGLKQSWQERREDRKVEKGGEWGMDAGRLEEARVVEMLETKWAQENRTVNVQLVPPHEPLLANMPSGREYHSPQLYQPDPLNANVLVQMRAPPEPETQAFRGVEADSGDDEALDAAPVGAFSGTGGEYGGSTTGNNYY